MCEIGKLASAVTTLIPFDKTEIFGAEVLIKASPCFGKTASGWTKSNGIFFSLDVPKSACAVEILRFCVRTKDFFCVFCCFLVLDLTAVRLFAYNMIDIDVGDVGMGSIWGVVIVGLVN